MHLKNCYLQKCYLQKSSALSLPQIKHQLFHLCHTYFRVLYEMHSETFLQQLSSTKGFKYFEHSKQHTA
jgi:hypothetical protein